MANFNFFPERTFLGSWKRSTQLSSDGYPKAKPGGAEFKWASVNHGGTGGTLAKATYLEDQLDVNRDPQGVRLALQNGSLNPLGASGQPVSAEWVEGSGPFASADGTLLNAVNFANSQPASDEHPVPAGMKVLRYGSVIVEDTDGKFILATSTSTLES